MKASTTGNIYGIYDMSGGAWERVVAYVDNGLTTNGLSIISADNKYKDIYAMGPTDTQVDNYDLFINKNGDTLYETSTSNTELTSWFSDYSNTPSTNKPWFIRGGAFYSGSGAGAFSFHNITGGAGSSTGFRPVLAVGTGL
jgi:hypothetical protein